MGFAKKPDNPSEVIGCTQEAKGVSAPCIRNNTIIEFRPIRTYNGEFGFDWLRVDDRPVAPQVANEPPYKDCILGSHKSGYTKATPNPAAYNDLKTEYQKLNVTNHRAAPKNEYFIPWLNLYSKPTSDAINTQYMAANSGTSLPVKPPYQADLRMIADIQGDKPYKIELEFESEYLSINASPSPFLLPNISHLTPNTGNQELRDLIKIECLKDFAEDQFISAWAYQYVYTEAERKGFERENKTLEQNNTTLETENKNLSETQKTIEAERKSAEAGGQDRLKEITDRLNENLSKQAENNRKTAENKTRIEENTQKIAEENKTLAGKLCVCPNDAKTRKTVKILMINVRTNFSTTSPPALLGFDDGTLQPGEEDVLYRALYQALVYPEITKNLFFDRSNDTKLKMDTATLTGFVNAAGEVKYGTLRDCFNHLKKEFFDENKLLYKEHENYPLFFFGIKGEGMGGVAFLGQKMGLMFDNRPADTVPHETLHGLGLHHTHMDYKQTSPGVYDANAPSYSSPPNKMKYVYFMARPPTHPDANYNCATSNFMSYKTNSGTVFSTDMIWRWQWQIIRGNL